MPARVTRIYSWNVNGLRACAEKGFLSWLASAKADVVGLQETRATPEQLPDDLRRNTIGGANLPGQQPL